MVSRLPQGPLHSMINSHTGIALRKVPYFIASRVVCLSFNWILSFLWYIQSEKKYFNKLLKKKEILICHRELGSTYEFLGQLAEQGLQLTDPSTSFPVTSQCHMGCISAIRNWPSKHSCTVQFLILFYFVQEMVITTNTNAITFQKFRILLEWYAFIIRLYTFTLSSIINKQIYFLYIATNY